MSVIVAIKYKDGIAIASDKQASSENLKVDNYTKINKMEHSNIVLGSVGSGRISNIIEIINEIIVKDDILSKVEIDRKYIMINIVPKIFEIMKDYGQVLGTPETCTPYIDANIMICTDSSINIMENDGCLITFDNFATIGCGEQLVYGYLSVLKEEKDFTTFSKEEVTELLENCIKKACKDDIYINDKIDFIYLDKK